MEGYRIVEESTDYYKAKGELILVIDESPKITLRLGDSDMVVYNLSTGEYSKRVSKKWLEDYTKPL